MVSTTTPSLEFNSTRKQLRPLLNSRASAAKLEVQRCMTLRARVEIEERAKGWTGREDEELAQCSVNCVQHRSSK